MDSELAPIYENVSVRLTWRIVCGMACKALCMGMTFEEACEHAVRQRIMYDKRPKL